MFTFSYTQYEDEYGDKLWMPHIGISFENKGNLVNIFPALVDTGSTYTVLPAHFAEDLGFKIDRNSYLSVRTANGIGHIYPASSPVNCILIDTASGESTQWQVPTIFFSDQVGTTIIGHKGCLEKFNVIFMGEDKYLEMEQLF